MNQRVPCACVIGWPVKHSRSPLIHGYWLRQLGLRGEYGLAEITPENLRGFIADLQNAGFVGANITVPHKETVLALCTQLTARARAVGAVNTIWFEAGQLHGDNTDVIGFSSNLDVEAPAWRKAKTALVLGAGGAARAVLHALIQAGIDKIILVNRSIERAQSLAGYFSADITCAGWDEVSKYLPDADLLVNTTSLGMKGQPPLEFDFNAAKASLIVHDIVYVPLETEFLRQARARGLTGIDGLGMLLYQAVPGFEHWFGQRPQVTADLRALIIRQIQNS